MDRRESLKAATIRPILRRASGIDAAREDEE
jgi:hypothetical protein